MANQSTKTQAQIVIPTSVHGHISVLAMTQSAIIYTVDPKDHLRIDRDAEDRGLAIIGVVHSHTHTEPYPSPTDVAQAPDPQWHYVIIGLKRGAPETRSYRIIEGQISETRIIPG